MIENEWTLSTRCEAGACVEVRKRRARVGEGEGEKGVGEAWMWEVRDSKNPDVVLTFSDEEWQAFRADVMTGEFA